MQLSIRKEGKDGALIINPRFDRSEDKKYECLLTLTVEESFQFQQFFTEEVEGAKLVVYPATVNNWPVKRIEFLPLEGGVTEQYEKGDRVRIVCDGR